MEIIPDNRSLNEKAKDSEWYAWILLFYLLQSDYPNQRLWEEFSHDIVYKNRFSSSSDVLKEILNKADDVEYPKAFRKLSAGYTAAKRTSLHRGL